MQKLIAKAREWLSNITILDVSERIVISNTSSVFIAYVFMTLYQMDVINPVATTSGLIICFVCQRIFSSLLKEMRNTVKEYFIDVKYDIINSFKDFWFFVNNFSK